MNWINPRSGWEMAAGIFAAVWAIYTLYIHWFLGTNFQDIQIMMWVSLVTAVCLGVLIISFGVITGKLYQNTQRYQRIGQVLGGSALVMIVIFLLMGFFTHG
ncbi:hypothetical protein [Halalkalicoccus subterraneus]|jgi:hypothetical protein|uniref:hypothetical protein n=1 Tax=Halalkalicoccus subterraneus TaxID=2675002 RepID=UPI000EFD24CB|nr:hypothetical protein [Halalkalicoccus subterraneus]